MTDRLRLRRDLLKIMDNPKTPVNRQREAQKYCISLGTGACDKETIKRFINYRK